MRKKRRSAYLLESLEARLLFSADLAPLPVDDGTSGAEFESDLEVSLQPDSAGVQEANENTQERQEVIFVDSGVDDYQQLIDDIESQLNKGRQFDIVNLESDSDGIDQISAYLKQHEGVDAVHVVSHGSQDAVKLGNVWLTSDKLDTYADAIEGWQQALTSDADLLFYGCNLAAGDGGQELVNSLTLLTGADVAASDDVTGSAKLGGDWDLEYRMGQIDTSVAFSLEAQKNWNGVLTTFTVNTTADTVDANPGDGIAEDSDGNTSLRAAIMEANALAGADSITLSAGTYSISIAGTGDDVTLTGDLDITSDLTITGMGAGVTVIDGGGLDRVFHIDWSGNATITNLTVQNGGNVPHGGGIRVSGGGGGGRLNLENVIVRNNTASVNGGGIFVDGVVTLTNVEITGNTTSGTGGGLSNDEQATLTGVAISGNSAADGGGIYNSNQGSLLELTNVTVSGNTATVNGGGIYTAAPAKLTNVTLTSNLGGGGIYATGGQGDVQLKNSILANNTGGNSNQLLTSQGYNIEDGNSAFTPTTGDQPNTDPLLGPLQLNGGFTRTHALLASSPAIDPAGLSGAPSQDQRGYVRDVTPDIGAYEYNVANTAPTITSVTGAPMVGEDAVYSLDLTFTDPDDSTVTWTVNWGDGRISSAPSTGATTTLTHTYTQPGFTYNILVSANDGDVTVLQNELLVPSYAAGDSIFRYEETTGAFLQEFATANGLDDPIQAIIGPDGNLYVTSEKSDQVLRYNAVTGTFIDEFVSAGSGGLNEPGGLAFGPDGNLYVSSFATDEILRYDGTSGAFIDAFVTAGSGGLNGPYGLTFGSDGNLYIASYLDSQVLRYNGTTGAFIDEFVSSGSGGLSTPEQMIFGPDGNLYIASFDSNDVLRYNGTTGAFIDTFVAAGVGGLDHPSGLSFGPDGNLYVADHQDEVVLRYNGTTGAFIDEYVSAGSGGLVKPVFISFLPKQQVLVNPVNDAPTLSGGPYNLGSTDEDNASTGVQVTTILGGLTSSDADGDTLGIAVVTASGNGTWQYSTNSTDGTDGTWTAFGSVDSSNALLLSNTSWVRYVPDGLNGENVNIDFHAWDGSTGSASVTGTPSNADPAGGGGATAYSNVTAIANLTVTDLNDAPTITSVANTAATEDSPYSYTFTVNDVDVGDTLTLSAPTLPAWLTFNTSTGVLSGTPTNAEVGDHAVVLRVNDGTVDVDQSFTITVANTNDAPTITSVANTAATEDSPYSYTFTVNDVDVGDTLTLSAPTLPAWLTFNTSTGVLSGTPTNAEVGDHAVVLRVNDGTVNVDQSFTITVVNTNDAPTITSVANTAATEDSPYSYTFTVNDVDVGDTLTLSAPTLPAWLTFNTSTGVLSGTPTNAEVGDHAVVLRVNDGTVDVDQSFTITVANTNDAGTVTLDNMAPTQGDTLTANVTDPDGATGGITYQWKRNGANISGATVSTYTTVQADVGTAITVTATYTDDLGSVESPTSLPTANVLNANDPGSVTIDNMLPAQGDTLTANVIDPDGASGAISFQWFSDGAVIGGATGKTYTTTQGDVDAVMTVTAIYTDDQGTAESLTSAPTAPVTNVNDTPIAVNDNLNAIEDQSMTFTSVTDLLGNDSDIDGDSLTISSFSQPANGSLADNGDGTVTYTSAGNFSGVDSFTYTVSDSNGGTAAGTAIILVTPVGDTPQVTNVSTNAEVQSGLINIDRNANDGAEVTHFKISGITNGNLYMADGVTRIDNGDFITVGQGQAGLRFTPVANSTADGSFNVESSEDGASVASQSGIATSTIRILTTAPQPSEPLPSLPPSGPEEIVSEETELEESEDLEDVTDETDVPAVADDMASVEAPQNAKAPGIKKASLVPGISVFKRADLSSNDDRTPGRSTLFSPQTLKKLVESENLGDLKTALRKLDIATLPPDVYALVRGSLDAVQEEMGKEILLGKTVVGSAIATSVGLSAGYVVWMLKGGSLLASVLSSLPAWQLADPLAILVGTKEDEDEDEDDDTLETIIKDGSRRNEDKERKASELNKRKKESTKR